MIESIPELLITGAVAFAVFMIALYFGAILVGVLSRAHAETE